MRVNRYANNIASFLLLLLVTIVNYVTFLLQCFDPYRFDFQVAILSRFYGLEMAVVDTLNAIINRFGEDKNYGQRVFLLFDGVHYDPLYLEQSDVRNCT